MADNKAAKSAVVEQIKDRFSRSSSAVLIDYIGLTVEEVTQLRNQFREAGVEYKVLKNTMISRAVEQLDIHGLEPVLNGPTAVAFSFADPTAAARILIDFQKKVKKTEIKCGVLGTKVISPEGVTALSNVPPKEVVVAQLLGLMNSPARGLVTVLSGPARGLVTALDAIRKQKTA